MAKYTFDHWEVNGVNVGSANPTTIGPVTTDLTVKAVYQITTHTILLDSSPSGVTYVNPVGTPPFTVTVEDGQSISVQVPHEIEA